MADSEPASTASPAPSPSRTTSPIRCEYCGEQLVDAPVRCPKCGRPTGKAPAPADAGPPEGTGQSPEAAFDIPARGHGPSMGGVVAVLFAIIIALLIVAMATGYNQNIPYLHPAANNNVSVVGDRTVYAFLFVSNGTLVNSTVGTICPTCPISVPPGGAFNYTLRIVNDLNSSIDVTSITSGSGFTIGSVTPRLPIFLAGDLSEEVTLAILAPNNGGVYVLPVTLGISVA